MGVILSSQLAGGVDHRLGRLQERSEQRRIGRDNRVYDGNFVRHTQGNPERIISGGAFDSAFASACASAQAVQGASAAGQCLAHGIASNTARAATSGEASSDWASSEKC